MKGHLYSDFILNKISIIVAAGYSLLFFITLFITSDEMDGIQSTILLVILLLLWLNGGVLGTAQSKGKARQYAMTFPQGKKGYVLSKYVFCVLMTIAGIICGGLCAIISETTLNIDIAITIINICFIFLWLELAFTLIFGENHGSGVLVVLFVAVTFLTTAYILFGDLAFLVELEMEDVNAFFSKLGDNMSIYSTIANLAVLIITFPLSCKFISLDNGK